MRRRPNNIVQRVPIFLGCEGESEQGYGRLLNDLLRAADLAIHLEVVNLNPGTGDPISRLRRAEQEIKRRQVRRSEFKGKAVLMDSDQVDGNAQWRRDAEQLAQKLDIRIIWQEPSHEALLLRHLAGRDRNRPPTTQAANAALQADWPEYRKPMTRVLLARRIGLEEICRAAAVEVSLAGFLREVGLVV